MVLAVAVDSQNHNFYKKKYNFSSSCPSNPLVGTLFHNTLKIIQLNF